MGLLSLGIFFIGFVYFFTKHKSVTLVAIVLLSTSYFGFVREFFYIGSVSLQHGDLALLLIFSLIHFKFTRNITELNGIRRSMILFFSFLFVSVCYDVVVRDISLGQVFRTVRHLGYFAFFFLIPRFKYSDYRAFLIFLLFSTFFHGLIFLSQYLFGYSYSTNLILNEFGQARYGGSPVYLVVSIVILTVGISKSAIAISFEKILLVLLILAVVFSQSRGAIFSVIAVLFLQQYLKSSAHLVSIIAFLVTLLGVSYIVGLFFPIISERFSNIVPEINLAVVMDYGNLQAFFHEGSLLFRWGMTFERFVFVLEDPVRMLLGVGYMPDMDLSSLVFVLGTHSPMLPLGFEQYNSVDIFFPNIITRYGFLGSVFFLYMLWQFFKFSYRLRSTMWGKILYIYLISMLVLSLVNESFYNGQKFFIIFVLIGIVFQFNHISRLRENYN